MPQPEKKDQNIPSEDVVCVYCSQVMGWWESKSVINPDTNRREIVIIMADNPNLPPICDESPDRQHANMTPEQAGAQGFL